MGRKKKIKPIEPVVEQPKQEEKPVEPAASCETPAV